MPRQSVRITAQQESHLKGTKHIGFAELDLHYQTSELMCHRPQRAILKRKSTFELKKKKKKDEQKQLTLSPSDIKERSIPSASPLRETGLYRFSEYVEDETLAFC